MSIKLRWFRRKHDGEPAHIRSGIWGERLAERFLKKKGYKILGRRVRVGKKDEIDLLAREGETLVFVEVKTRANEDFGRPVASVDRNKRRFLSRAAVRYMQRLKEQPPYFRFDVVEVVGTPTGDGEPEIRHLEAAFPLDARYRMPY